MITINALEVATTLAHQSLVQDKLNLIPIQIKAGIPLTSKERLTKNKPLEGTLYDGEEYTIECQECFNTYFDF